MVYRVERGGAAAGAPWGPHIGQFFHECEGAQPPAEQASRLGGRSEAEPQHRVDGPGAVTPGRGASGSLGSEETRAHGDQAVWVF
jgi:hypothetical protein